MKDNINLYREEFHPKFEWITLSHMAVLSVATLILIAFAYSQFSYYKDKTLAELLRHEVLLEQQQSAIAQMTQALSQRSEDPYLVAKLESLSTARQSNELLLSELSRLDQFQEYSFSGLFDSLGAVDTKDLWLTGITVEGASMLIAGDISTPIALPLWIRKLSSTEYFNNTQFKDVVVSSDSGVLSFTIQTLQTNKPLLTTISSTEAEVRL